MSFGPFDSPMRKALEDLDRFRRMTGGVREAVREIQEALAAKQEFQRRLGARGEIVRRIEERQDLIRQLEKRREVLRLIEEQQDLYRHLELKSPVAALSNLILDNRRLIDSYVYGTLDGGGPPWVGSTYGLGSFGDSNVQLADSYEQVSNVPEAPEGTQLSPEIQAISTVEVFSSAEVIAELDVDPEVDKDDKEDEERQQRRQLRREIRTEVHQQLVPALERINPGLVKMWDGGLMAISSSNPDRVRHFTVSLRELTTQLLHQLAPDDEIRKWNSDPDLYDKGRPTRRGRMRYICRLIDQPAFQDFVTIDYKVLLETIDLFHRGTHVIEAGFSDEQIHALETRTAHALLFLLQLGKRGS